VPGGGGDDPPSARLQPPPVGHLLGQPVGRCGRLRRGADPCRGAALFGGPAALPTQPEEIITANGATARLTVCTGGKSHPQNHAAAEPDTNSGASVTASGEGAFCLVSRPYTVFPVRPRQAMPAAPMREGTRSELEHRTARRCRCGTLLL